MSYSKKVKQNILPIWQPVGFSTHLITQRVGEHFGVKTSHTGTLDPMAEGVIIVLLGQKRFKKKEYAFWKKGYEFEIALGMSTDTYDGMGLITEVDDGLGDNYEVSEKKVKKISKRFLGKYKQEVPPYSTKKIKGKHLHQHARKGKKVKLPTKKGRIYKFEYRGHKKLKVEQTTKDIINRVLLVTGDFRQEEIIQNWKEFIKNHGGKTIEVLKFYVETSKGIYIRSLTQDICGQLETPGLAYKIKRTKNGKYTAKNSKKLEEIFGPNYQNKLDFVSKPNLR